MSTRPRSPGDDRAGIRCPRCGGATRVTHTERLSGDRIRRRRACRLCAHRFVTFELRKG